MARPREHRGWCVGVGRGQRRSVEIADFGAGWAEERNDQTLRRRGDVARLLGCV